MRSTMIAMFSVLLLSIAICIVSMIVQFRTLADMDALCKEATGFVKDDDTGSALAYVDALEKRLDECRDFMEMVASHDQLHEAMTSITDARVALECDDLDDAYQALARLSGTIDHLREHERLSLSNLW